MIIYMHWITRADLQRHPDWLFVFGDNVAGIGYGGQAKEMRGEPNAVGVCTKWTPTKFFSDDKYDQQVEIINGDMRPLFKAAKAGKTIVLPAAGIGTGLADLPTHAPRTLEYLYAMFDRLRMEAKQRKP